MVLSILIFVCVYLLIISEKVDKTIASMLGAFAMLITGALPYQAAIEAIDFNVIFLLSGMMICVFVLSKTGFFEWVAISVAKATKGNPLKTLLLFLILTAVLSAFLDNVTTIILLAPVTILVAQILEISPVPFLILEALASNIGGTATLVGDPPNIVIGSQANLGFNEFLLHLGPVVLIVFAFFVLTVYFLFKKEWNISESTKQRVIDSIPHLAIIDKTNMIKSLAILGLIFIGFFMHNMIHLKPGVIAISGSMIMLVVCKASIDETLGKVEWSVIFFFIGLFMVIAGLEYNGVLQKLANSIVMISENNLLLMCMLILVLSALLSSFLDNIPFVMTMIPIIKDIIVQFAQHTGITDPSLIRAEIGYPLWWALALGACLGGNGTLIGASANILVSKIGEKNKNPITFAQFFKFGFPFMLQSLLISAVYLWLRYF